MQICTRNRTEVKNALPIQQHFTLLCTRVRDVVKKLIPKKSISSTTSWHGRFIPLNHQKIRRSLHPLEKTHQGVRSLLWVETVMVTVCGDFGGKTTQTENAPRMRTPFCGVRPVRTRSAKHRQMKVWMFGCWWRCQVKSIQAALIPAINGDLDCKSIPSCGRFVRAEQQDPKESS